MSRLHLGNPDLTQYPHLIDDDTQLKEVKLIPMGVTKFTDNPHALTLGQCSFLKAANSSLCSLPPIYKPMRCLGLSSCPGMFLALMVWAEDTKNPTIKRRVPHTKNPLPQVSMEPLWEATLSRWVTFSQKKLHQ